MDLFFDHLIYWVQDPERLGAVCHGFEQAGFTVTDRPDAGRDTAATRQRLICFADGSYVEILTVRDPTARTAHRLECVGRLGDGWLDHSWATSDLDPWIETARAAGLPISGPKSHEKTLEDGRPWGVRLINLGRGTGDPVLPFILQDTVGRDLRIPKDRITHANGVTGIGGVTLAVRDLAASARSLSALFGPGEAVPTPPNAAAALRFTAGGRWIDLVQPAPAHGPFAEALRLRGDSLVAATFTGPVTRSLVLSGAGPFSAAEIAAP